MLVVAEQLKLKSADWELCRCYPIKTIIQSQANIMIVSVNQITGINPSVVLENSSWLGQC